MWKFLIFFLTTGCVNNNYDDIYVKSGGEAITSPYKLSFYVKRLENESPMEFGTRQKIATECTNELARQNIEVVDDADSCREGCYVVTFGFGNSVSETYRTTPVFRTPVNTNCSQGFNGVNCTTTGGDTYGGHLVRDIYFNKSARFLILDATREKVEDIREVITTYVSSNSAISRLTAEYFCRGFVVGLNKDVDARFVLPDREE